MEFERDPETSDTDNDVQFKVSSALLNSISGWDRGPHSHTPHPEMERGEEFGYKSEPSLRGGGWCDNLLSGVRVNEKRKKQDKKVLLH